MDFVVSCEHCGGEVLVAPRVAERESAAMREHLRYCASVKYDRVHRVLEGGHGGFAELLRHFRIAAADQPRV